jgi:acyl-CoA reductase-like NAD-dependent aldehyde dehydrogenase
LPPEDPNAGLAAFTIPGAAKSIWNAIENDLKDDGAEHMTAPYGDRLVEKERCGYLRPTVVHCQSPETPIAKKEFMYPFVTVVQCPQADMLKSIGPTLVCSAITGDQALQRSLIDAVHIDRLNLGPLPTIKLDWLQPHEGNIVEFLFRARALQTT